MNSSPDEPTLVEKRKRKAFKILEHLRYLEKTHLLMSIHNICFLQVLTILSALGLKTKDVSHRRKGKFRQADPINDKNCFVCDFFLGKPGVL